MDETRQALTDFLQAVVLDRRFETVQLGTYGADQGWDPNWELRFVTFNFAGLRQSTVYHATHKEDPSQRYSIYWDPDISNWSGWRRMY
jgi:hypothetical protein